jgi:hypothetical protein
MDMMTNLFEQSLFHDDEAKHAKCELHLAKRKAKHEAKMIHTKHVDLEGHVAQLNAFRRRNA